VGGGTPVQAGVKRLLTAVLPLALLLSACAESGGGSGSGSGSEELGTIRGTVLAGPTCPVETIENPCPDRPVGGVKVQALSDGSVSATAVSDEDGAFEMDLAAGEYLVESVVEPEGPGMYSRPTSVTVTAGAVVEVSVLLDTGIRAPVDTG